MKMKILKKEKCLCACCMEEHEVETVLLLEHSEFKNTTCEYEAEYQYCDVAEELYMTEDQLQNNDTKMKDAYRKASGLLTSEDIYNIRIKYGISQSDLCTLLGWGGKTITRYESHQVQDKAHDAILKKIDHDPEWFIALLNDAKAALPTTTYEKYLKIAKQLYAAEYDRYLQKAIEASSYKEAI